MSHQYPSSLRGRLPDSPRRTRGIDRSSMNHGSRPAPVLPQEESWSAYRDELQRSDEDLCAYEAFSGEMAISDRRLVGSLPRRFSTYANRVPALDDTRGAGVGRARLSGAADARCVTGGGFACWSVGRLRARISRSHAA